MFVLPGTPTMAMLPWLLRTVSGELDQDDAGDSMVVSDADWMRPVMPPADV